MALHVPKAPGFAQMLKDGAMVSILQKDLRKSMCVIYLCFHIVDIVLAFFRSRRSSVP